MSGLYRQIVIVDRIGSSPVPIAEQPEVRTVFGHSNTGIVGSNPTRGMDVSVFFCVVVSCVGRGLPTGRSPVQGLLPTVQIDT
jgi:hypothetical protein